MKTIWLFLFTSLISTSVMANTQQAVATVSSTTVAVQEPFQMTITVNDELDNNQLDLSPLEGQFATGNISTSRSMNMINGSVTRKTVFSFPIMAINMQATTIPPVIAGQYKTQPINLDLRPTGSQAANIDNDVLFETSLSGRSLYPEQTLRLTAKVKVATPVNNVSYVPPFGDNLLVQKVGEDKQYNEVTNGRQYTVVEQQFDITATEPGQYTLQAMEFSGQAMRTNRRGFSTGIGIPFVRQGESYAIDVRPIPADYQGLWLPTPMLAVDQHWQPANSQIEVGDAITREIILSIQGIDAARFPKIDISYPSSVSVYEERPEFSQRGDVTTMTLKQVLIPRQTGEIVLPGLEVNWWDTEAHQQRTAKLDSLMLNAIPSTAIEQTPVVPQPEVQTNVEPQVITEAGVWPWLTALFATLWLMTLMLWLKAKQTPRAETVAPSSPAQAQGLIAAINSDNPLAIQAAWRNASSHTRQHAQQAMNTYLAACYGNGDNRKEALNALLTQVSQVPPAPSDNPSRLAGITP